jgi:hypothetical protein
LDLSGATINLKFASGSDVFGFDLRDYSAIYNGTINVVEDGAPTGSDKAFHCAVLVGNSGGSLAGYTGFRVSDLVITSNRGGLIGGRGILVQASSNNGIIENIQFPDSANLGSGVQISWAGPGGNPPATSEHPYNISVRNIRFGTMTKSGTSFDIAGIDIVGSYNIIVENVQTDRWAGDALVQIRVGGFGDTVAPAEIKPLLFKNIIVRNVASKLCNQHCVIINGRANDAVGAPVYSVPAIIQNVKAVGPNTSSTYGVRLLHVRNVIVDNCEMEKFQYGCYVEENTRRITIREGRYFSNTFYGVAVVHGTTPEDVYIDSVECVLNGSGTANGAGFYVEQASRVQFNNCISGEEGADANQTYGFAIQNTAAATKFSGVNRVRSVKAGGTKYFFLAEVYGDRQFGGGSNAPLSTSSTEYAPAFGVGLAASNDTVQIRTSVPLILFNFQVLLSAAPGSSKTREFQILDDGTNSTLEVAITGSAVSGIDYGVVEVAAGSTLSIKSLTTNTPAAANASWGFEACVA